MLTKIIGWCWHRAEAGDTMAARIDYGPTRPATKDELLNFFTRMEAALDESRFLLPVEKRPAMVRSIRNMFQRMQPTEQDLRTLHGVVVSLFKHRGGG